MQKSPIKDENLNLNLNMKTNVRSKTPRYVQSHFPNEMSQYDKNWQLKASCQKYKQWQENFKLNDKNFQYLHMLMWRHFSLLLTVE